MTAVLETTGLRREFGEKVAVADLTLAVEPGEVFGFLGPNGAGKTTSLKMMLGLIAPTAGQGRVLGAPLGDRRTRARLGFLPEHFRFHDWLTGRELLHVHGRLYGMRGDRIRERAEALLARVDLLDAARRPVREYSKGMLQRIGLAQALLNEPALVFLDEPTSGLDPLGRLLVRDIIHELKRAGTSVFLNSHLLGEVEATCDRVVFVKAGRTVRELKLAGAPAAALEVTLELEPLDAATLAALGGCGRVLGHEAVPGAPAERQRVRLEVERDDALPAVAALVVARGARLYRLDAARKPLEQWFLEVMGEGQRPG